MRVMLHWTSIVLFTLLSLFMLWFGWLYASVQDMLWFHAAAVPEELRAQFRPLYLALMNLIGGSSVAFALLALYLTWGPLRRGDRWAAAALSAGFAVAFGMAGVTAEELAAQTGAPTSWHIMGLLLAVTAAALGARALSAGAGWRPRRDSNTQHLA